MDKLSGEKLNIHPIEFQEVNNGLIMRAGLNMEEFRVTKTRENLGFIRNIWTNIYAVLIFLFFTLSQITHFQNKTEAKLRMI